MAKRKFKNIDSSTYEKAHFARIEKYASKVDAIYDWAAGEFARIAGSINKIDPTKPFSFSDYPQTSERVADLLKKMAASVDLVVKTGIETEWLESAKKNNDLVDVIFKSSRLTKKQLNRYNDRNLEGLKAFQQRKADGLSLSDRVWNYTSSFRSEIEIGLDAGIGEGKSAQSLSRLLRSNLKEPDKLFRRVRDNKGTLRLSSSAKSYNPGRGVYRSSYKNAMRLTRTETNMAYKASDQSRWQQLDFVVGVEIKLSNNPNHCPTCVALAGKYPKDFKFVGWHPQCRCFMISILKTDEELDSDDVRILQGLEPLHDSVNQITSMPSNFNRWIKDNEERANNARSTPYFIRDNFKDGKISKGLKFATVQPQPSSTPYLLTDDLIKTLKNDQGIKILGGKSDDFNKYIPGFDIGEFDSEITRIFSESGITLKERSFVIDRIDPSLKILYTGAGVRLERTYTIENGLRRVSHDYFIIPKELQGKGISKDVFKALHKQYMASDVDMIDVYANIDIGGYTWAKYGFNAKNKSELKFVERKAKNTLSSEDLNDFENIISRFKDGPIPMLEIANTKYGKKLLLGTSWEGEINLKNPVQRKIFEDYLGL